MKNVFQRRGMAGVARLMSACVVASLQILSGLAVAAASPPIDPNFPPGSTGSDPIPEVGYLGWAPPSLPGQSPMTPILVFTPVTREKGTLPPSFDYLGFLEGTGSLLESTGDGGVYLYNRLTRVYVKKFASVDDITPDVLAALKNRKYLYVSKKDRLNTLPESAPTRAPAHVPVRQQEADPNLPHTDTSWTGSAPLRWQFNPGTTQPWGLNLDTPNDKGVGLYLGFNERGSWLASAVTGKVFVWNAQAKNLSQIADSWWDIPTDLKNPSVLLLAVIYYRDNEYPGKAARGTQDPNFPPSLPFDAGQKALPVRWNYAAATGWIPQLTVVGDPGSGAPYVGFDERGAWIQSIGRGIYAWNFRTLTLSQIASRLDNVPREALARLHNANEQLISKETH